jgi:thiamine biosynthesis protein ThiC
MSVCLLLKEVSGDTIGAETCIRVVGNREPPGRMSVQVAVKGTANVQIQGKIAREAPWLDLGPLHSDSALLYIEPVQFLRAVSSGMAAASSVSVWAVWAW